MIAEEEKDLGIVIDSTLKVKRQVTSVMCKATWVLAVTQRSFADLNELTLTLLCKALVQSHLQNHNMLWSPFYH